MSMGGGGGGQLSQQALTQSKISEESAGNVNEITDKTLDFTSQFFEQYIQPVVAKVSGAVDTATARNTDVYGQMQGISTGREADYQKNKGVVDQYLQEVQGRDATTEGESAAGRAIGDVKAAGANAEMQQARALQARGLSPTSGAAVAGMRSQNLNTALVAASEANRARRLAGLDVAAAKQGAAGFVNAMGNTAAGLPGQQLGAIGQGVGVMGTGISAIGAGADPVLKGYETAGGLQVGLNKSSTASATDLNVQQSKQDAAGAEGTGKLIGTIIGTAGKMYASDRRLKTDIVPIETKPDGLVAYNFKYIWDSRTTFRGYMADEVEKLYPEAIGEFRGFKTVDYSKVRYQP